MDSDRPPQPTSSLLGISAAARAIALLTAAALLYGSLAEFYNIAWGTGTRFGELSLKWGVALGLFAVFCLLCLIGCGFTLWPTGQSRAFFDLLCRLRGRSGWFGWLLVVFCVVAPVWLLQFTVWGVVIAKPPLRLLIFCLSAISSGFLLTRGPARVWSPGAILTAVTLVGACVVGAAALSGVTNFPFSLGWSEGNRLWDYSLMFAKRLYDYPAGNEPVAYLDFGRQLLGGLPFLLSNVSIMMERLWVGALSIWPYLLLGLAAFRPWHAPRRRFWIVAALWVMTFLTQGPIHAPLVICAALVAIAWNKPIWLAAMLVALSGYFAEISRFTWMFAPAMWAVMLELGGVSRIGGRIPNQAWRRVILMAAAGLLGSALGIVAGLAPTGSGLAVASAASTKQTLLWYRLLPNATYGSGILLGLVVAAGPLVVILTRIALKAWKPSLIQFLAVLLPLAAFLIVGLVVSTKIGGGGDLHNLDMFLIGLIFAAALVLWSAAPRIAEDGLNPSGLVLAGLILLVALPAYQPLMSLRPLSFSQDATWLAALADVARPRDLGSLPDSSTVSASLEEIRAAVRRAEPVGEVLFMDQRQLLTFGFVTDVALVPDYEKKRLMDEALSGNRAYFDAFYRDLAQHRFSLIISSPLRTPIKDNEYGFGEENNAWVNWIARPVLCYYTEQDTLTDVRVELLAPRAEEVHCDATLPR